MFLGVLFFFITIIHYQWGVAYWLSCKAFSFKWMTSKFRSRQRQLHLSPHCTHDAWPSQPSTWSIACGQKRLDLFSVFFHYSWTPNTPINFPTWCWCFLWRRFSWCCKFLWLCFLRVLLCAPALCQLLTNGRFRLFGLIHLFTKSRQNP